MLTIPARFRATTAAPEIPAISLIGLSLAIAGPRPHDASAGPRARLSPSPSAHAPHPTQAAQPARAPPLGQIKRVREPPAENAESSEGSEERRGRTSRARS